MDGDGIPVRGKDGLYFLPIRVIFSIEEKPLKHYLIVLPLLYFDTVLKQYSLPLSLLLFAFLQVKNRSGDGAEKNYLADPDALTPPMRN